MSDSQNRSPIEWIVGACRSVRFWTVLVVLIATTSFVALCAEVYFNPTAGLHSAAKTTEPPAAAANVAALAAPLVYSPRLAVDEAGFRTVYPMVERWSPTASITQIADKFDHAADRLLSELAQAEASTKLTDTEQVLTCYFRTACLNFDGKTDESYEALSNCRRLLEENPELAAEHLYTVIYLQGLVGLRKGETENCIMCRGESSCILPIAAAAVHQDETGSRMAIRHFTEYLSQFPEDAGVRWLLNIAHMTLAEHPNKVDPRYLVELKTFVDDASVSIGKFRDVGHKVGLNRFNLGGGGIMEDFDNDGLLDVFVSTFDPTEHAAVYFNENRVNFVEATESAGLLEEKGGIYSVQTDYDNDGDKDVLIVRGAWLLPQQSMPMSLLRNNGDRTFTNVTQEAGLGQPVNSISACWADYDNDGWLDVFVCTEHGPCRLYRNRQNGTFEDVAAAAGVAGAGRSPSKGATWLDFNNDGFVDLFVNYMGSETARFYVNNRDGTFSRREIAVGIDGPQQGFACWAWDYDNDGWEDIFATSYDRTLESVIAGLENQPHRSQANRLFRNLEGKGFQDVTKAVGLDRCFATMGSNFGDFDNDGFLDMYLGTGDPNYSMLVPNRMFRNLGGTKFAEITASSGTGNLQKGHGTACGDWDGDGNVDLFIQMGGAVNGDKYHNILFQNPGHANAWVTLKLEGSKSNRAAIGARVKVVTPQRTVYRTITSGSSFGANPLQQTIGLGNASSIERVEITWPTSEQTQVIDDLQLGETRTITEPKP